ncbi:MFS transporter [Mycetocola spongiae]|uniref:MFS transporter n=1 Tax=Mycetocola spongiae TaxID=2859226 RepID=UPI001CF4C496|nr:MFS transporter [Mycetocola spongiae]UCR89840.1 MFS transporter [Mycetocola spongiae]
MSPLKTPSPATPIKRPQVGLMLGAVFLVYLAQMTLNPIIAPLAREVGLAEWQVGVMISVAAICIMISSQFWGRKSLSWGRKPVLIGALTLAMLSMVAFALLARLGMAGILGGVGLFLLLVLVRGVFFGLAMAAVPPTAQAYIADVTETEEARVRGMAGMGAVQGIAMISGSIIGGLLAGFGLMVPLIFVPCVLAVGALLVLVLLRRESPRELLENPPHVRLWDSRVWPFLAAGFGMFTALGLIQVIAGFIIQDRFSLDSRATAVATAAAFLVSGIGLAGAQAVLVPRLGWHPHRLLRAGAAVALLGFAVMIPTAGIWLFLLGMLGVGLGLGLAMPGYVAGPSLLMTREEQGAMAGLIGANNAATFVLAPTIGTALYTLWPPLTLILSAVLMLAVLCFTSLHPRFRVIPAEVNVES